MEQYIYSILAYLPVEFEEEETNDFIDYLVGAYNENLQNNRFQFSFTAFHMLYMSFIYKTNWFLNLCGDKTIQESLANLAQQNKVTFNTMFDLSQINEKTSLEKLMLGLSFHINEIGICKNLVEVRNNCSHASGKVYYERAKQIEHYLEQGLENVQNIHKKTKPYLNNILNTFINKYWDTNWIESDLKRWIIENYLSQKDMEEILKINPTFVKLDSDNKEVLLKKLLRCGLIGGFLVYVDDPDNYFEESLTALMQGLPSHIDIRKDPADAERLKSTQELIEEKIVPILTISYKR